MSRCRFSLPFTPHSSDLASTDFICVSFVLIASLLRWLPRLIKMSQDTQRRAGTSASAFAQEIALCLSRRWLRWTCFLRFRRLCCKPHLISMMVSSLITFWRKHKQKTFATTERIPVAWVNIRSQQSESESYHVIRTELIRVVEGCKQVLEGAD